MGKIIMKLLILSTLVLYIGATNPEPRIMPGCKKVGDHWICPTPKPDQIPENCHKLGRPGPPGPFGPPEGVRCVCNEVHNRLMRPDITKNNEVDNCVLRKEGNINFIFCDIKKNSKDATSNASITKSSKPPTTEPPKMNCKEGKTFILCENYVCKRRGKKLRCPTLPKNVDRQKCEKFDNTMVCPIKSQLQQLQNLPPPPNQRLQHLMENLRQINATWKMESMFVFVKRRKRYHLVQNCQRM